MKFRALSNGKAKLENGQAHLCEVEQRQAAKEDTWSACCIAAVANNGLFWHI